MYQTAPNRIAFRQYGPSGQAFMACALSKSLLKSTRHIKTNFYSQAKMLGGLCASKVRVFVFCVFLQPLALMFQKAPI
jgi:hypothetical protein